MRALRVLCQCWEEGKERSWSQNIWVDLRGTHRAMEVGVWSGGPERTTLLLEGWSSGCRGSESLGMVAGPNTSHRKEQLPSAGRLVHPDPTGLQAPRPLI